MNRWLVAYAVLLALLDLVVLLPGNPYFASTWGAIGAVAFQAWLVWRLDHGSGLAWGLGLLTSLGSLPFVVLQGSPIGVTETLFVIVCLAQAWVLLSPPVRALVWPRRDTPPAATT
jgi:hypothetical protein